MSTLDDSSCISWAAYHSLAQQISVDSTSIIAMLPLFFEKADFPAMVRHSMNLLNKISEFLNLDCPIFAFSDECKDFMKITPFILGGLHTEKTLDV